VGELGVRPRASGMSRVLDLDLDAFIYGSAHWREPDGPRLEADEFPPWTLEKLLGFLESQCLLTGRLPGYAVEDHGELFFRWRDAIDQGLLEPPFHITHVDAHADIGLGDSGYVYLLTELLREPVEARRDPRIGNDALGDGNFLAFAVATRWVSAIEYVLGGRDDDFEEEPTYEWVPGDLLPYIFEDFDPRTRTLRLPIFEATNLQTNLLSKDNLRALALEPPVPFDWEVYQRGL
jgi:hypothetical protein